MLADLLARHHGPYRFCITRQRMSKAKIPVPQGLASEWLTGKEHAPEEVGPEALALLADQRDTIIAVHVWSERENQFVALIRSEKDL